MPMSFNVTPSPLPVYDCRELLAEIPTGTTDVRCYLTDPADEVCVGKTVDKLHGYLDLRRRQFSDCGFFAIGPQSNLR